jgi:bifunctional non-homologous end joining protein LigD
MPATYPKEFQQFRWATTKDHVMSQINQASKAISLYCTEGSADKVYQAALHASEGGWVVEFAYGKRGQSLKTGTKTLAPVAFDEAVKIYNKLVKEKTAKGYTEDQSGVAYTNTEHEKRASGIAPQLPTSLDASELERHILDDSWGMQQKRDGENRLLLVKDGLVRGINRRGLFVDIPQQWAELFAFFPDCLIAGEAVGLVYYAFDLLELKSVDLRTMSCRNRFKSLEDLFSAQKQTPTLMECLKVIPMVFGRTLKRADLALIELAHGEGVVFKLLDASFESGKCKTWLKHKFVESATCVVLRQNQQRSVAVGLRDETGLMLDLGNVTISENFTVPDVGSLVEIRFLYRYEFGCFEQPVYLGSRTDIDVDDAVVSQITRIKSKTLTAA